MTRWQALPPRSRALMALLAVSVLATLWAASQSSDEEAGAEAALLAPRKAAVRAVPPTAGAPVNHAAWPAPPAAREPWPRVSQVAAWGPPPPAAVATKAPPPQSVDDTPAGPPPAPPFPYTLIGRLEDGPLTQALLSSPRRTLGVKANDVIDGQWRVNRVDAAGLSLTWLPGGQTLTLTLAARPS